MRRTKVIIRVWEEGGERVKITVAKGWNRNKGQCKTFFSAFFLSSGFTRSSTRFSEYEIALSRSSKKMATADAPTITEIQKNQKNHDFISFIVQDKNFNDQTEISDTCKLTNLSEQSRECALSWLARVQRWLSIGKLSQATK